MPWRKAWEPTPVFLPRESHGQRSLAGYQESDMRKPLSMHAPKERASGVPSFAWVATTLLGSMYPGKGVLPPGIALKAHESCSSPLSEAWGMIIWCQELAYPGTESEPFPAAQNKVSLTHTPRHLSVPVHKRGIIRRAHQICLWRRFCHAGGFCLVKHFPGFRKGEKGGITDQSLTTQFSSPRNSGLEGDGTGAWGQL